MFFYTFEFADFEAGMLIARRLACSPHDRLHADWSCQARSDRDALDLAKHAATTEWPRPATRDVLDFIVAFQDSRAE